MKAYSERYYEKQKNEFNAKLSLQPGEEFNLGSVKIRQVDKSSGRMDGYMHKDFREWNNFPVLYVDGHTMMSVTPCEIMSHYNPINAAHGHVGGGGLGLGYFLSNILDKSEVLDVTVFETNNDVIQTYLQRFGSHPKLFIDNRDVRTIFNMAFTFFYCDVYASRFTELMATDWQHIVGHNMINNYLFWGFEELLMGMVAHENSTVPIRIFPNYWATLAVKLYQDLLDSKHARLIDLPYPVELFNKFKEVKKCLPKKRQ